MPTEWVEEGDSCSVDAKCCAERDALRCEAEAELSSSRSSTERSALHAVFEPLSWSLCLDCAHRKTMLSIEETHVAKNLPSYHLS